MSGISLSRVVRIGAGAGYSGDRIEPAIELAERAHIDYLVFECLAERTIALARLLTKWWESGDQEEESDKATYYARILADRDATLLKLLDRTDNMQDLARIVSVRRDFAEKYLKKTRREFAPLLERCDNTYVLQVFRERLTALESALDRRR